MNKAVKKAVTDALIELNIGNSMERLDKRISTLTDKVTELETFMAGNNDVSGSNTDGQDMVYDANGNLGRATFRQDRLRQRLRRNTTGMGGVHHHHHQASNNTAEYKALINGLRIAIELGAMRLYVRDDSELVIDQVMKESSYKSPLMEAYCQEVSKLEDKFQGIELHHVPQKDNDAADFITKFVARRVPSPDGVFINDLHEPSAHILEDPNPDALQN
ncbi:uncharacterized protein [Miscanthus floridulus]|uniref:uncharacterized protein n=1 Tax=Miscanthus floridulus TaxID=154761 RepID=UPI003459ED42